MRSKIVIHLTFNVSGVKLLNNQINHKVFSIWFFILFYIFLQLLCISLVPLIFPYSGSNSARKCLILPVEGSPQISLFLLEILLAEFIQA